MHEKILTIVIPTYNMEKLLPRCLDSLVTPQSSDSIEVLVVNDGSKDNSLNVAQEYEKKYPGIIKAIDKENGNYGSTINKGIEIASGKYFRILDSDDFYSNSGLMEFVKKLETTDSDIILTDYRRDRGQIHDLYKGPSDKQGIIYNFDDVDTSIFANFAMHGITYKTSVLRDNKILLSTGISYTDSEYCFYPIPFIHTFVYYDILVYCYQVGRPGQTVDVNSQVRSIPHMMKIINRMYDYLKGLTGEETYYQKLVQGYCNSMNLCFSTSLCYDRSNRFLDELHKLKENCDSVKGANDILMKKRMFGVLYYKRYCEKAKASNGIFYTIYYKVVRFVSRTLFRFKSLFV